MNILYYNPFSSMTSITFDGNCRILALMFYYNLFYHKNKPEKVTNVTLTGLFNMLSSI